MVGRAARHMVTGGVAVFEGGGRGSLVALGREMFRVVAGNSFVRLVSVVPDW